MRDCDSASGTNASSSAPMLSACPPLTAATTSVVPTATPSVAAVAAVTSITIDAPVATDSRTISTASPSGRRAFTTSSEPTGTDASAIAVFNGPEEGTNDANSCALLLDGRRKCWGANARGRGVREEVRRHPDVDCHLLRPER